MKPYLVPARLFVLAVAVFLGPVSLPAQVVIDLEKPGEREFVRDLADLIDAGAMESIKNACDKLLTEKATPIIVVTIKSMDDHRGSGLRIETFTRLLFDQCDRSDIGQRKIRSIDNQRKSPGGVIPRCRWMERKDIFVFNEQ